jgi:hypothetical protein
MSGYDSLEDVWVWECPECPGYELRRWSPRLLERHIEVHEWVWHQIPWSNE